MLPETVGNAEIHIPDALYSRQREDVAKMRASLLACSDDPVTSTKALQNITVLRVYHQVSRIIRYLEMMDKIEDKLYQSLDYKLDTLDVENPTSWMTLITIQEKLQANMLASHKLLQPYIDNMNQWKDWENSILAAEASQGPASGEILPRGTRNSIRLAAQQVLSLLPSSEEVEVDESGTTT